MKTYQFRLSQLTTWLLLAILLLAMGTCGVAIHSAVFGRQIATLIRDNVEQTRAAEELELALLAQRLITSEAMLDPESVGVRERLDVETENFRRWMSKIATHSSQWKATRQLDRLAEIHRLFQTEINQIIERIETRQIAEAMNLHTGKCRELYEEAYARCEDIISAQDAKASEAIELIELSTKWELRLVSAFSILILVLSTWLLSLLYKRFWKPLQQLWQQTKLHLADSSRQWTELDERDPLGVIGASLHRLMSSVEGTKKFLDESTIQIRHSEKLASVGQLAACVAHEIRNPLTAIKVWLFSLRESFGEMTQTQKSMIDSIETEIRRLDHIVKHFLLFSRPPQIQLTDVDLNAVIDDAIQLVRPFAVEKDIRLMTTETRALGTIKVDRSQLTQVLTNVLLNALQASSDGSVVGLKGTLEPRADTKPWIRICVEDHGGGVPPENQSRIFEPFFTTKADGSGLGLSISASIMTQLGGKLTLDKSDSESTIFSIWLPQ